MTKTMTAEFSQSRNDMYWTLWMRDDGFIRWTGYDDDYWWDKVSKAAHTRTRVGKVTGCTYTLNFETCVVEIDGPALVPQAVEGSTRPDAPADAPSGVTATGCSADPGCPQ